MCVKRLPEIACGGLEEVTGKGKKTSNPWVVKLSWLANAYSRLLLSAGDLDE